MGQNGEITTDGEEEKEEENGKKKGIFKRIWPNLGKSQERPHSNLLHSMFTRAPMKLSIQGIGKNSV